MKKNGILNAKLMEVITELGHFDSFVICDMGFPIPKDALKIDLALEKGTPSFMQTLKAILREVVVQEATLMEGIKIHNPKTYDEILAILTKQTINYCDMDGFRKTATPANFYVRTGEFLPCSNIILVSASGVDARVQQYDVKLD
jgi:D-ribose pyranase